MLSTVADVPEWRGPRWAVTGQCRAHHGNAEIRGQRRRWGPSCQEVTFSGWTLGSPAARRPPAASLGSEQPRELQGHFKVVCPSPPHLSRRETTSARRGASPKVTQHPGKEALSGRRRAPEGELTFRAHLSPSAFYQGTPDRLGDSQSMWPFLLPLQQLGQATENRAEDQGLPRGMKGLGLGLVGFSAAGSPRQIRGSHPGPH